MPTPTDDKINAEPKQALCRDMQHQTIL